MRSLADSQRDMFLTSLHSVVGVNALTGVLNFITGVWFARTLGPNVLGEYAIIFTSLQILVALTVPGFNQAIIREPMRSDLVASASVATLAQSVLVVVGSSAAYGLLYVYDARQASEMFWPAVLLLVSLILSFFTFLLSAPFEAQMNYRFLSGARLSAVVVGVLAGIVIVEQGFGIYGLVIRDLSNSAAMMLLVSIRSPIKLSLRCSREAMTDLSRFGMSLWGLNILDRLALRLDYVLVGILFDKSALGVYFALRSLIEGGIAFVVSPIQTVMYAFYCQVNEVAPIIKTILSRGLVMITVSAVLGVVAASLLGRALVLAVFGNTYLSGSSALVGLVVYAFAVVWFENLKVLAMSRNMHDSMLKAKAVQFVVSFLLIYPFTQIAGFAGAGMAIGVSALAMAAMATWTASRWLTERHDVLKVYGGFASGPQRNLS